MSLTITYNGKPVKPSIIDQLNMPDCEPTRKYIKAVTYAKGAAFQLIDGQLVEIESEASLLANPRAEAGMADD